MYDKIHIVDAGRKSDFQPYHLMSHSIKEIVIDIQEADGYCNHMFRRQNFKGIPIRSSLLAKTYIPPLFDFFMKLECQQFGIVHKLDTHRGCFRYDRMNPPRTFSPVAVPVLSAFQVLHIGSSIHQGRLMQYCQSCIDCIIQRTY
jgi:hypothetical protein